MPKYTQEKLWKIVKDLPEEIKTAIFSSDTADAIWDVCEKNDVQEVPKIAENVGYVLMGLILPENFQETLEKEIKMKKEMAKKVTMEINRLIFYPIKPALESLYTIKSTPDKISIKTALKTGPEEETLSGQQSEEKPQEPQKQAFSNDSYRESIE